MDGTIGFALHFCVGTNYHFLIPNQLLRAVLMHSKAEVEMSEFHSFCDPPNHSRFLQGPMRFVREKKEKAERGNLNLNVPTIVKKIETLVV
jgi:hypothetical protein